jgi:nucleoside-diphosphate-sugar epimerase
MSTAFLTHSGPKQTVIQAASRILVVGGAGYIGSVLVRDLLADGYEVRVLDSLIYGEESLQDLASHPRFALRRGDFRRVEDVVRAVRGVDAVIHLGGIVGDMACAFDENQTLQTNVAATRLLAEVCRALEAGRFLFASTCSVYGAASSPVDERSALKPLSLYAASKADAERLLLAARSPGFHPSILRLATAFGWSFRPRFDLVVNLLAAKAAVEKQIVIYNREQWRPFIHVADISRAFRAVLAAPVKRVSGEIFNVGSNRMNATLGQLAERIAAVSTGLQIDYVDNPDARSYRPSFEKIRQALGFECAISLESGIREIQSALRCGLITSYEEPRYHNAKQACLRRGELPKEKEYPFTALAFAPNSAWSGREGAAATGQGTGTAPAV